jgi:fatty-acyl-CoA synthase
LPGDRAGENHRGVSGADAGANNDAAELQAYVKHKHGAPWSPKSIDFVDAIPVTGLGKIDRKALRAPYWEGRSRGVA